MCSTLTVRGALEVHSDRKSVRLTSPDLVAVSVADGQLWFHTEAGRLLPQALYRDESESRASFLGFCLFFVLDGEDAITEVRLSSIRAKHRIAIFRPKTNADFALCLLLYAIESLPLSKATLEGAARYLYASNPRTGLTRIIRKSCVRMICTSLYLFFDVTERPVMQCVPQIYVLYKETQRSSAGIVAETYFGVSDLSAMACVSLAINERPTRDGDLMGDIAVEVLNQACNVFYVPLGDDKWLSNDCHEPSTLTPAHQAAGVDAIPATPPRGRIDGDGDGDGGLGGREGGRERIG
nr:tegument protein UL7 [Murid betaherpesvirus 2]